MFIASLTEHVHSSSLEVECKNCIYSLVCPCDTNTLSPDRSFFQGLCVLGYCIAPLDIAALISCFVRVIYVRAPIALLAWAWCIWGKHLAISSVTRLSPDVPSEPLLISWTAPKSSSNAFCSLYTLFCELSSLHFCMV